MRSGGSRQRRSDGCATLLHSHTHTHTCYCVVLACAYQAGIVSEQFLISLHFCCFKQRFYSLFTLVVEIVLFNVISAMFVESTMEAAAHISNLKRRERMQAS